MYAVWQQILAVDAKFNAYRVSNNPQYRTLYLRRRSQLLQERANKESDSATRRDYLQLRVALQAQRYGVNPLADTSSLRSRTQSLRSMSHQQQVGVSSSDCFNTKGLIPTEAAEASRAMAGDTTLSENYAFSGMHHIFDQHKLPVYSVKFGQDDKSRLACCSMDGQISVCQVLPDPPTVICVLQGHTAGVTDFVWSIGNDRLLSCSLDATVKLWSVASGKCIRTITDPSRAQLLRCIFQPTNNNLFVTASVTGVIQVMNLSTGKAVKGGTSKMSGSIHALAFDDSGSILWAGDQKGTINAFNFDVASGKINKTKRIIVYENCAVTSISFRTWLNREARDPSLLVNCACDTVLLYRVTGTDGSLLLKRKFTIVHRHQPVRSNFCPLMSFRNGACIVTGSEDGCVFLFDVERDEKACVNKLMGHSGPVLDVSFNYDESMLASCDTSGTVIVWQRESKSE